MRERAACSSRRRGAPDCSSFEAAGKAMEELERRAVELEDYRDEPPQMKSAAVGKKGYLRL